MGGLHRPPKRRQGWLTFLRNHREVIVAMDFFTVPAATFRLLYVWFASKHSRREIVHWSVTESPTAPWVVQQSRETFPFDDAGGRSRYLVLDRDAIFSAAVAATTDHVWAPGPVRQVAEPASRDECVRTPNTWAPWVPHPWRALCVVTNSGGSSIGEAREAKHRAGEDPGPGPNRQLFQHGSASGDPQGKQDKPAAPPFR
jgi:hypothetical protein